MEKKPLNFIEHIIEDDLANGYSSKSLRFRFPPEPNGYLHIGHTKALEINFGLGKKYSAPVNLRFDDTNPAKEDQKYVDAIKKDIEWLGYKWDKITYSSDFFEQLFSWAILLIKNNLAFVDSQDSNAIAEQKGTPVNPGTNSPFRSRDPQESLSLFYEMREGKHKEGVHVLRAKIDMSHPNMLMRDPVIYRVVNMPHQRTKNKWPIYPMYDFAHGQCDYIEQISHSLCSLEFRPHRDLYVWFIDSIKKIETKQNLLIQPKQREFARLNLSYTIMSKRKLVTLVENDHVLGWDDPRMPTISGLRRRGYTPNSIKNFINKAGVAKRENIIDVSLLEYCVREDLNKSSNRAMAVINPITLTITNYPKDKSELLSFLDNPESTNPRPRKIPFSFELCIEAEDFSLNPAESFNRLSIGQDVRLKSGYIVTATKADVGPDGKVHKVYCTYDPKSLSGSGTKESKRKVKSTIHWVCKSKAVKATVMEYNRLFVNESPDSDPNIPFEKYINPKSLIVKTALVEPALSNAKPGDKFQFQRLGYFSVDDNSEKENLIFNKTVSLKAQKQKSLTTKQKPQDEKLPIEAIKKIGKKFMKLDQEKRLLATKETLLLASKISYSDLVPMFKTAQKKTGTRAIVLICLSFFVKKKASVCNNAKEFVVSASKDENETLKMLAKKII